MTETVSAFCWNTGRWPTDPTEREVDLILFEMGGQAFSVGVISNRFRVSTINTEEYERFRVLARGININEDFCLIVSKFAQGDNQNLEDFLDYYYIVTSPPGL